MDYEAGFKKAAKEFAFMIERSVLGLDMIPPDQLFEISIDNLKADGMWESYLEGWKKFKKENPGYKWPDDCRAEYVANTGIRHYSTIPEDE